MSIALRLWPLSNNPFSTDESEHFGKVDDSRSEAEHIQDEPGTGYYQKPTN